MKGEKGFLVNKEFLPTLAQNKRFRVWFGWLVVLAIITVLLLCFINKEPQSHQSQAQVTTRIYPNYTFENGVNQIRIPLIPFGQELPREAGGWVIIPVGSEYRVDYEIPVVIEYIDGRKFHREPHKPVFDGIRPVNSVFRLYGRGERDAFATITIKRGVY